MRVLSCEQPRLVYNKYLKTKLYVPCGTCNTCILSRSSSWRHRLEEERLMHRFCFMLYLSYNDLWLPVYHLSQTREFLYTDDLRHQPRYPNYVSLDDLYLDSFSDKDFLIRRAENGGLPFCSVRDVQLFKKRLSKYVFQNLGEISSFRSFICSEYGPNTFRPHYHGILFTDSAELARVLPQAVYYAWSFKNGNGDRVPFGISECKYVESSAISYVASYLNSVTHYPSFYRFGLFSTFHLVSQNPPLGCFTFLSEEVREMFFKASPVRLTRKRPTEDSFYVPLGRVYEDRLFPKCVGYRSISSSDRELLYFISRERCFEAETFELFLSRLKSFIFNPFPSFLCGALCRSAYHRVLLPLTHGFHPDYDGTLKSIWLTSRRVFRNCELFSVSPRFYVRQIELYYNNVELFKLKNFYALQEAISSKNPRFDFSKLYFDVDHPIDLDYLRSTDDFINMVIDNDYILSKTEKTKDKNGRFEKVTDKVSQKLVLDYYASKHFQKSSS